MVSRKTLAAVRGHSPRRFAAAPLRAQGQEGRKNVPVRFFFRFAIQRELFYCVSMILSRKDVEHVALLARLELSDEEIELYTKQLNQILDYFRKLQELNTDNVQPTSHAVPMEAVLREDVQKISGVTDDALSQAPAQTNHLFLVPKIIE